MKTCTVAYNKKCVVIESGKMRLAVATDKGPRVVGCFIGKGSKENMFAVLPPEPVAKAANGYCFYGGHRLWHSPEDCPLSYEPDNEPVNVRETEDGIFFEGKPAPSTGIQKSICVQPLGDEIFLVRHMIRNCGIWPVEIAPWALTMMAPGGLMILPQGFAPEGNPYTPDRNIVLWPYTNLADKRLKFTEKYILVQNDPSAKKPLKLGYNDQSGWIGYANLGNAFIKYIDSDPGVTYPDRGCNVETYTCNLHTEIETLGGLETVKPGDAVFHAEYWQGLPGVGTVRTEKDVETKVVPGLIEFDDECCCDDEECDCGDDHCDCGDEHCSCGGEHHHHCH